MPPPAARALAILLFAALAPRPGGALERIEVAVGEWPPIVSELEIGYGNAARAFTEVTRASGYEPDYLFMPWPRAMESIVQGRHAVSIAWSRTAERAIKVLYPEKPLIVGTNRVFYKRARFPDGLTLDSYRALAEKGLTMVGIRGYWYVEPFRELGIPLHLVSTPENAWHFLDADRADAMAENDAVGWHDMERALGPERRRAFTVSNVIRVHPNYPIFSRAHPLGATLRALWDRAAPPLEVPEAPPR